METMNGNRIMTTHVGSLVRPPPLVEFLKLTENGVDCNSDAFSACLQAASLRHGAAACFLLSPLRSASSGLAKLS